jgi:signal transduction histidine kinase/DNA-binding response OmpR family regulator/ligand-binding sensor domain-containing protein
MIKPRPKFICQLALIVLIGFLLTISLSAGKDLFGQVPYHPEIAEPLSENWRWRLMEGLSAKGVRSITDDTEDNMWFGLNRGIIRYDGYNWTSFDQQPWLKHPVTSLKSLDDGRLFAGSESGLLEYRDQQWYKIFPANDTFNIPVTCIRSDSEGNVFAGVQNGMIQISDSQTTIYTVLARVNSFKQAQPDAKIVILPDEVLLQRNFGRVDDIFIMDHKTIWLFLSRNNDGKLIRFSSSDTVNGILQKFEILTQINGQSLSNRTQVLRTNNNELWMINGFYKSGILRNRGQGWEGLKLSDKFGGDELHTAITQLNDGSIWIGGLGKLFVFKNKNWQLFTAPSLPIPSSRIIFHESRNGKVWIAGIQGDVFHINYDIKQWVKYSGLNFQFQDGQGRNWFISKDDQVVFNDMDQWYSYDNRNGLIDAPARLTITDQGTIWAAGSHQGVAATARLENDLWTKQIHPLLSWGIDPRSVFQDKEGSLWFGAAVDRQEALGQVSGVLQLINPDGETLEWVHHTQRDGIVQHNVYGIGQSPDGSLWLGGTNLLRFTDNRWSTISDLDYFNEFVDIVHSRNNLWVGSRYYGLFRYDGHKWVHFTKEQGLPSNTIISVFEEYPESVWVITDRDLAWHDGEIWTDGLFPEDLRIPREGGEIMVSPNGSIWVNKSLREWRRRAFPFSITPEEAMDEFWVLRYNRGKMAPKTSIELYTEKVDPAGNTFISWSGNDYWEETPSDQLTYSWRLNGGEWSGFSHQTSLVLTKLKSGKYTFEVRARDLDANIEAIPATILFTVRPPVWMQAWFIILVISFLIIIGYYEFRLINRNRSLFKLNISLSDSNKVLESRQQKIELQKEKILQQKEELERKTIILEEKTSEIVNQRDKLQEMVQKIEELSNVKQRFFTNISHEFRTPLTLILGSIEQLLNRQQDNDKSRINQAYETIQRSSRRILRLINQILEIRKIETGRLELNTNDGDIVSFTQEIVSLFNDMASNQGVKLDFETGLKSLPVSFDHDKIEKILFNLLSNAFKSTPEGGKIKVTLERKTATSKSSQAYIGDKESKKCMIRFRVEDTGKGIPETELEHIFDRFYQVNDNSYSQRFGGSGIGLSYVKDLVTNHGGEIQVESEPEKGTRFTFVIPCIDGTWENDQEPGLLNYNPSQFISKDIRLEVENLNRWLDISHKSELEIPEKQPIQLAQNGKLMAMVVEDEHELRKFIRETLEPDFEVIEAYNGAVGYEKALAYQPDIIVTDVMMPEMNGIELCARLKSNLVTNHIPVIMLTARIAPENKVEGYQSGADAYLEKPFNMEFLRIRINNLLQAQEKTREKVLRELITQPSEVLIQSEDDKMLEKIRDLLEENISNPDFDVESLSQEFSLSRFHFSRKIKQITGLTPKEIMDSFRLKRAGQILQQNKLTVSEIAYMVGFDHPNSFSRAFRKYFNMTPSEFASKN